jgi:hypothetical protein
MDNLPEVIAALAVFGLFVVCPLIAMLMRHQRSMAELFQRGADQQTQMRIAALENELMELRARQNELILRKEDDIPVGQRLSSGP